MMRFTLVALALLATPACAQELMSREDTLEYIGSELADINENFQPQQTGLTVEAVKFAIERVMALRERLADNPYVRIESFSVGLPAGVSVDFTFPDES